MSNGNEFDFIIVGAGIIGLTLARELANRNAGRIAIFEKEAEVGIHSSGRNSGVLHAGVYYPSDSIKAKVCSRGAVALKNYAREKNIRILHSGKVIVATKDEDISGIETLYLRAKKNGVRVEKIDEKQLLELEPACVARGPALFSPDTSVIDSKSVLKELIKDLKNAGVSIFFNEGIETLDPKNREVKSALRTYSYGHLINAAGLHADRIAHKMGVGLKYRILPFKGLYRKLSKEAAARFRGSIYPVPDLRVPFLGVHITRNVDGEVLVGPTAIPAFGRENYGLFDGLSFSETPHMISDLLTMMLKNSDSMRTLVSEELRKYSPRGIYRAAKLLSPTLQPDDVLSSGKVGLRPQLVDEEKKTLVMDFLLEKGPASTHILNAISPAFTSSFAFAEMICEKEF